MTYQTLLYEKAGGIGTVTINRPESHNALNGQVYAELYDIFGEIEKDDEVRVVILTGAGGKAFVAGSDITEMAPKNSQEIVSFGDCPAGIGPDLLPEQAGDCRHQRLRARRRL